MHVLDTSIRGRDALGLPRRTQRCFQPPSRRSPTWSLTAWCEQRGVAYDGVPVGTIKRHVTGKGNADKAAVRAAVRAHGFVPADDNEADAIAIAILLWAIETRGGVR